MAYNYISIIANNKGARGPCEAKQCYRMERFGGSRSFDRDGYRMESFGGSRPFDRDAVPSNEVPAENSLLPWEPEPGAWNSKINKDQCSNTSAILAQS